ncbi:MAG: fibronectin type III domain-containing protein [Frankiaceae bacterium]|nr:fibronectin type III domain-containing protein [Frankiaceae bacterium]
MLTLPRDAVAKISHLTLDGTALDGRAGGALVTGAGDDTVSPALAVAGASTAISTVQRTIATGGSVALYGDRVNGSISATAVGSAPGSPSYTIAVDHSVVDSVEATGGAAVSVTSSDIRTTSADDGLRVDRASSPSTITNDRVSGPGYPKIGISESQVDIEHVTATGSANGIGLQLTGATTGTFSCLDVSGNADGVKTVASGYAPAPTPTISTSDLTGNTSVTGAYDVDNAGAVTTSDVWWGQAGGPQPGQVRNPALLTDQNPRTAAANCGGRPTTPAAAPTNVTAQGGTSTALVSWTAPTDDGGSPISGWTVTAYPGGVTTTVPAGASNVRVTGLTPGTTYTFAVVGTNAVADSPPGIASATLSPAGAPEVSSVSAPALVTANPAAVPVSGTAGSGATTVELTASDGQNVVTDTAAVGANGAFSANLDLTGLRDGNVVLDAVAKAADGTPGPIVSRSLTKDTQGPAVRAISMHNPLLLHARVTGKTEPNSRVSVVITDRLGHLAVASTVADSLGVFNVWPSTAMLAAGPVQVEVRATDPYGHVGDAVSLTRTMPPPPTPSNVTVAGPTRSDPHTATVSGSAPAQSVVTILLTQGGKQVRTSLTVPSSGTFSRRISLPGFTTGWVTVSVTGAWAAGAPQSAPVMRRLRY